MSPSAATEPKTIPPAIFQKQAGGNKISCILYLVGLIKYTQP